MKVDSAVYDIFQLLADLLVFGKTETTEGILQVSTDCCMYLIQPDGSTAKI